MSVYSAPETLSPKPQTLNPKPQTLNPKPQTLNPRRRPHLQPPVHVKADTNQVYSGERIRGVMARVQVESTRFNLKVEVESTRFKLKASGSTRVSS